MQVSSNSIYPPVEINGLFNAEVLKYKVNSGIFIMYFLSDLGVQKND